MKLNNIIFLCFFLAFFAACEDVIEVDLKDGNNQLVVDAWIDNLPKMQTIKLSRTSPYFQNTNQPVETGATVKITSNNGTIYDFEDADNDGTYTWTPPTATTFGNIDEVYTLSITTANGDEYSATSSMNRIMPIDTITLEDREEELGQPAGIYAEFFARDMAGEGDAYWIKSFKNGQFLNKPQELNLAWDAAFTPEKETVLIWKFIL